MAAHHNKIAFVASALLASAAAHAGENQLTFHGTLGIGLSKLAAQVSVSATNTNDGLCMEYDPLQGGIPKSTTKTVSAKVDGKGNYKLEVPLNVNLPLDLFNLCKTAPRSVLITVYDAALPSHLLKNDDGAILVYVDPAENLGASVIDLAKIDQVEFRPDAAFGDLDSLPNGQNYEYVEFFTNGSDPTDFSLDLSLAQ